MERQKWSPVRVITANAAEAPSSDIGSARAEHEISACRRSARLPSRFRRPARRSRRCQIATGGGIWSQWHSKSGRLTTCPVRSTAVARGKGDRVGAPVRRLLKRPPLRLSSLEDAGRSFSATHGGATAHVRRPRRMSPHTKCVNGQTRREAIL
jgi:hypothetical protein